MFGFSDKGFERIERVNIGEMRKIYRQCFNTNTLFHQLGNQFLKHNLVAFSGEVQTITSRKEEQEELIKIANKQTNKRTNKQKEKIVVGVPEKCLFPMREFLHFRPDV